MQSFKKTLAKGEPSTHGENQPNHLDGYQWPAWGDAAFRNILPSGRGLALCRRSQ
jgi:hypothetical protein